MTRTKWMRLGVRDPADILRWAAAQDVRDLAGFRYRVLHGREFVSFRMIPRYAIQIGTRDIVVVAHVKPRAHRLLAGALAGGWRWTVRALATLIPAPPAPAPVHTAALYQLTAPRLPSPSRGQHA